MRNPPSHPEATSTVLDGRPIGSKVLTGSVTGRINVPAGVVVEVHGVLEDALVSGEGTVRVSGLIADVIAIDRDALLARPGSVRAPDDERDSWLVLQEDGDWAPSPGPVFPSAVDTLDPQRAGSGSAWWPVART